MLPAHDVIVIGASSGGIETLTDAERAEAEEKQSELIQRLLLSDKASATRESPD